MKNNFRRIVFLLLVPMLLLITSCGDEKTEGGTVTVTVTGIPASTAQQLIAAIVETGINSDPIAAQPADCFAGGAYTVKLKRVLSWGNQEFGDIWNGVGETNYDLYIILYVTIGDDNIGWEYESNPVTFEQDGDYSITVDFADFVEFNYLPND